MGRENNWVCNWKRLQPLAGDRGLVKRHHRGLRLRLEHILKGIARLERKTAGRTAEDYLGDEDLRDVTLAPSPGAGG